MSPATKRKSVGIAIVISLLNGINDDIREKLLFTKSVIDGFSVEFPIHARKDLKELLNTEYRNISRFLEEIHATISSNDQEVLKLRKVIKRESNLCKQFANNIKDTSRMQQITVSLIHMFCNRLFSENQRYEEFSIYYYLFKHYASAVSRTNCLN